MRQSLKVMLPVLLLIASLLLAGCSTVVAPTTGAAPAAATTAATTAATEAAMQMPMPEAGKVTVADARVRAAPLAGGNSAAYLIVLNGTDKAVRLTGAESPIAPEVGLHESINKDGVMVMEPRPEGFEVPAGGSVELKPGGKHVMFMGIEKPLAAGDTVDLTLKFDTGEAIKLSVPVVDITMNMPMNNMPDMTDTTPTAAP